MPPSELPYDGVPSVARHNIFSISRILRWSTGSFRFVHRAIVSAKLRRLQRELMFRHDYCDLLPPDHDATKFPQRPLVLGDKWDF